MYPGIFFGLALFFGIFSFAGSAAHIYMIYLIGLSGMGAGFFLTGLTFPKRADWINNSFQTDRNYPTILAKGLALMIGGSMLVISIKYWRDLPTYRAKDYEVISGQPLSVEEYYSKGDVTGIDLEFKNKTFYLDRDLPNFPEYNKPEELKQRHITIYYLPQSNWIVEFSKTE